MSTNDGGMVRYDINDPADLAVLIANGMVWRGGPKAVTLALKALKSGAVPRPANLPPEVARFLDGITSSVRGSELPTEETPLA